jgi:hypothetical protein
MNQNYDIPPQHMAQVQPKQKMSTGAKVGIGVAAVLGLGLVANLANGGDPSTTATSTTAMVPSTATTVVTAPSVTVGVEVAKTSFGPGTYLVGRQIEAGTYQAPGGSNCYFERRSDTSSDLDGIIANEWSTDKSQQIVTIDPTDVAFKSSGCGRWTKMT